MMNQEIDKITAAISKYSFTAEQSGSVVIVKNKKGQICAKVLNGNVEQLYCGSKNLCGALVRNDIVNALKS